MAGGDVAQVPQHIQLHVAAARAPVASQRGKGAQSRQERRKHHFATAIGACAMQDTARVLGRWLSAWHAPRFARTRRKACELAHKRGKKAVNGTRRPREIVADPVERDHWRWSARTRCPYDVAVTRAERARKPWPTPPPASRRAAPMANGSCRASPGISG